MSALPKPLQDALSPFAPMAMTYADQTRVIERQARTIARLRGELNDLLRLPFEVDLSNTNRLENERPITAPEHIVRAEIDAVIEAHIEEIEYRVTQRVRAEERVPE